ncbi:MAG: excinuclease ABC subunit UvrA [Bacteroidales bacterium]|nr:excinuclease ABC subunit UvrA [Bacteroidales bacterium]
MSDGDLIRICGAKANNLKNVDVDIPRNRLVVITGLSGSGKSSLAFDTIYAEGQRRYMNTLSPYAKHFVGILEKPQVESIDGLSPVIAIEQKTTGRNPRSTVGTITEVYDFLRLLYARVAKAYSPATGREMVRYSREQIVSLIMETFKGRKCLLLAPLVRGRKGHYRELFEQMRKKGYTLIRIDGKVENLADIESLDRYKPHFIELVVDRLKPGDGDGRRIADSVSSAMDTGKGSIAIIDNETGEIHHYSRHLVDSESGVSLQEPAPHSFSFNSPEGYCPHCKGLGMIVDINPDTIIPDKKKSIADGGIKPLGKIRENKRFDVIRSISRKYGFSLYEPIEDLPDEVVSLLIYGSDEMFRIGEGALSEMVSYSGVTDEIADRITCPVCGGSRLSEYATYFKIDGRTIREVSSMEFRDLLPWLEGLRYKLDKRQKIIAVDILKELTERVNFLIGVGLDYLTLDRPTASLSGGESQRIRLATQIGSKLVNVLYILDEPSIGLHQRDNRKLISSLKTLRDEGNSVIVVEHDAETMNSADWIIDVGPGAGELGGSICYNGPAGGVTEGKTKPESVTLDYLEGRKSIPVPVFRGKGNGKRLILRGARGNNLKGIDAIFPLGTFIGISGVSGSGKSSLISDTLMPAIKNRLYRSELKPLPFDSIEGVEHIDKLIEIDQSPIGRSPRSNPATFTGVFSDIRELFENTPDSKVRGFEAGRFSFNVKGGRCEECKGAGIKLVEMNFLPSINVVCEACRGKRYKEDTLEVRYKGKNISDVLEMSISEAYEFFRPVPKIAQKLGALVDVGLGYVRLGQSSVTLSGGESQRMKLAAELFRKATGSTLYILDEPTTGLHFEDINVLLGVLRRLVDQGNTVIIIEHNLDILKSVDYIIDMGPEGGGAGGRIISEGTPETVADDPESITGIYLKDILQ